MDIISGDQTPEELRREEALLKEVEQLKSELQSERALRENVKVRLRRTPRNACDASMQTSELETELEMVMERLEKERLEALEAENLDVRLLLLGEDKRLSTLLQLKAVEKQKLHLQKEMKKLLHAYKEVKGLVKSESEKNKALQEEARRLKQSAREQAMQLEKKRQDALKTEALELRLLLLNDDPKDFKDSNDFKPSSETEIEDWLVDKACQTNDQSSKDHEEKGKAREYEKSLHEKDAEMAALPEENQELTGQNKSPVETDQVRVETEDQVRVETEDQVRDETAPEPPQTRKRPSRWRRFINFFACGTCTIESDDED